MDWQRILINLLMTALIVLIIKLYNMKEIHIHVHLNRKKKKPGKKPWSVKEVFFIQSSIKTKGVINMQTAQVDKVFTATWPGPKDKYGNDATVQEGSIEFSSDDSGIVSVEANPDGGPYSVKIKTLTKTGATAIRIKADADLGEGVKTIEGVLAVEVVSGEATGFAEPEVTEPVDNEETPE